jgi:transglutaminase/protease-like cytokinesis protein 3
LRDSDNDQIIDSLIDSQNHVSINDFVEIKVADPQAFNNSFVQQRQQAMDNQSYRSTIESWHPKSLQQLVDFIKYLSRNKSLIDCHWIIFYWITLNIEYDTVSYFRKNHASQTAQDIFRTKKGVCAGYANLYKYLCDQLNISCEIVSGYSKGYGFHDSKSALSETDHAWNVVKIDNH